MSDFSKLPKLAVTAAAMGSILLTALPASAENLVMPDWHAVASGNTGGMYDTAVIEDQVSEGRAVEGSIRVIRPVRVRSGNRTVTRMRPLQHRAKRGVAAAGADLGNTYIAIPRDGESTAVYAATELATRGRGVRSAVAVDIAQGNIERVGNRVKRMMTAGDIRVVVAFRNSQPHVMRVYQLEPGKMRMRMKKFFGADGCAGKADRAMVCLADIAGSAPDGEPRTGINRRGRTIRVQTPDKMLEVAVNLHAFRSRWSPDAIQPGYVNIMTSQDVVFGNVDGS